MAPEAAVTAREAIATVPAAVTAAPTVIAAVTAPVAPPADRASLQSVVEQAGLQWVETDPAMLATQQPIVLPPPRAPRLRKPPPAISSAPLEQVETRRPT